MSSTLWFASIQIAAAESLNELKKVMKVSWEYLEMAGCNRQVTSLKEREALVEDLVSFTMITRIHMHIKSSTFKNPLVFDLIQVQLFPSVFCGVFCEATEPLTAEILGRLFTINFSDTLSTIFKTWCSWKTPPIPSVGKSSISLQDILRFAAGVDELPAAGLFPPPSISFLHYPTSSKPVSHNLLLPVTSTYKAFKSSMDIRNYLFHFVGNVIFLQIQTRFVLNKRTFQIVFSWH
uniref:Uncharacterized protein n=1 Tax=Fundulus heteroclitus TaxID=8078 RepID=A0A3Q2PTJ3_FUNHE